MSVFADYNATTPCSREHLAKLCSMLEACDGNPSSIHHFGRTAKVAMEQSRRAISQLLGAKHFQVLFTSGATESNNLWLQGAVAALSPEGLPVVVISASEHASVYQCALALEEQKKCRLVLVDVTKEGYIDQSVLFDAVHTHKHGPLLVSLILVNNEVGSYNDLSSIGTRLKQEAPHAWLHTDAVQALGKYPLGWLGQSAVDAASFSAHKVGALKGIGCLYVKQPTRLRGVMYGGAQEQTLRPGTENMAGILSFGLKAQELRESQGVCPHGEHSFRMRALFAEKLSGIPGAVVHGPLAGPGSNTVNFHVEGVLGQDLMIQCDLAGIAVSNGSACSAGVPKPSRTLLAMGYTPEQAQNSLRISFGGATTQAHLEEIYRVICMVSCKS